MLKYTRPQAMTENRVEISLVGSIVGFPYSSSKSSLLRTVGQLLDGGSLRGRLGLKAVARHVPIQVQREIEAPAAQPQPAAPAPSAPKPAPVKVAPKRGGLFGLFSRG